MRPVTMRGGLPGWIAFAAATGTFFFLVPGLITLSYHPNAPTSYLIGPRIGLAGIGVLAFLILALSHGRAVRRTGVARNLFELAAVPLVLWLGFQAYAVLAAPPDHIRLSYDGDIYAIPRVYRPYEDVGQGADSLIAELCLPTGAPVYAEVCSSGANVELSSATIMSDFSASFVLDEAGATYDGDRIVERGRGSSRLPDGSLVYVGGGRSARFLLGADGRIERFVSCWTATDFCEVSVRTRQGKLRFPARTTDPGAADFWRVEEVRCLATFDGWRCAEPTCGGRFS